MERSGDEMERELREFQERRKLRRERRKRRVVVTVAVTLMALVLAGLTAYLTFEKGMRGLTVHNVQSKLRSTGATGQWRPTAPFGRNSTTADTGRVNVLVVGTDEDIDRVGRTDTIMLVSFDPRTGDAGVLSIPRDTRVEIPGRPGYHRINVAHALGGPQLIMRTVEHLLGVDVHHYVTVNFMGFERFIDVLGGIEVEIDRPMRYDDFAQGLHIDLRPGRQVLNGQQALHYVRFRSDRLGDVSLVDPVREVYDGRVRRQLDFVELVAKKALSFSSLPKLPQLVQELFGMVRTDIPIDRALALVVSLRQFDAARIETAVLPGIGDTIGGASYWVHDPVRTRIVVDRLVRGLDVVTLEVLNGSGQAGAAARAADLLRHRGYDVIRVGNARDGFRYERTQVIVHRDDVQVNGLVQLVGGELIMGGTNFHHGQPAPVLRHPAFVAGASAVADHDVASESGLDIIGIGAGDADKARPDVTVIIGRDFQG